jgi:hypothetical protein
VGIVGPSSSHPALTMAAQNPATIAQLFNVMIDLD